MVEIVSKLAWPIVALVLGVIFIIVFRAPITALLVRLKTFSFGKDKELTFGQAEVDKRDQPELATKQAQTSTQAEIGIVKWTNSGNLFWLGHDLMWTMQMALRGAPLTTILHGLRQSNYHMQHLNLGSTTGGLHLAKVLLDVERTSNEAWNAHKRDLFASELSVVIDEIGRIAESNQPDFEQDIRGRK